MSGPYTDDEFFNEPATEAPPPLPPSSFRRYTTQVECLAARISDVRRGTKYVTLIFDEGEEIPCVPTLFAERQPEPGDYFIAYNLAARGIIPAAEFASYREIA